MFQQDNDSKHKAKENMELLMQRCPKIMDWLSNSPDINPIEIYGNFKESCRKTSQQTVSKRKKQSPKILLVDNQKEWNGMRPC